MFCVVGSPLSREVGGDGVSAQCLLQQGVCRGLGLAPSYTDLVTVMVRGAGGMSMGSFVSCRLWHHLEWFCLNPIVGFVLVLCVGSFYLQILEFLSKNLFSNVVLV